MIIFRYLTKQLLTVWVAVTVILLIISVSGRFAQYLNQAAAGEMKVSLLFAIMLYRIPGFLEIIMPLAFFISILVVYGRMHADSEMVVMENCGISPHGLLVNTSGAALVVLACTAFLSLWLTPAGMKKTETLINLQNSTTDLDMIQAGKFQSIGKNVYYVEKLSQKKQQMNNIFMVQTNPDTKSPYRLAIFSSSHGRIHVDNGSRYVILENGYRYDLTPGKTGARVTEYGKYGIFVKSNPIAPVTAEEAQSTFDLSAVRSASASAEMQWRVSVIFMIPVAMLLGLPLSRIRPRQGRYFKLLPSLLIFLIYIAALMATRGSVKHAEFPTFPGLYGINLLFLLAGFGLFYWTPLKQSLLRKKRT